MFNIKNLDWSYNSLKRYVLDLHIYLVVVLICSYFIEKYAVEYHSIQIIIIIWLMLIGTALFMRLLSFSAEKAIEKDKTCTISIEIDITEEAKEYFISPDDENYKELQKIFAKSVKDYVVLNKQN